MEKIAVLGGLTSMVISLVVGGRLVLLARRTQQTPELLIGLSLVLLGFGWSALAAIGRQATGLPDPLRVGFVVSGALCAITGICCLALFTRDVFRPGVGWASALVWAVGLALAALGATQTLGTGWLEYARQERGPWTLATFVGSVAYAWSSLEAWRHHRMLVRRGRLGLGNPVVTNRVRLWTIATVASFVASIAFGVLQARGIPVSGTELGLGLAAIVSLISASTLWLAFMPPAFYLESVRRRALATA